MPAMFSETRHAESGAMSSLLANFGRLNVRIEIPRVRSERAPVVRAHDLLETLDVARAQVKRDPAMLSLCDVGAPRQDTTEEVTSHAVPVIERSAKHLVEHRHTRRAANGEMKARIERRPTVLLARLQRAIHIE